MSKKKFKVTLVRGLSRRSESQIKTLRALGLKKRLDSAIVNDTPANRGQIVKVQHLLKVETIQG
jgi:large subunit ribosomal protein L30